MSDLSGADHDLLIESPDGAASMPDWLFEPVFRVIITASYGTAFNLEKDRFEFAEHYGLQPSDFGSELRTGSERYRSQAATLPGAFPTDEASDLQAD